MNPNKSLDQKTIIPFNLKEKKNIHHTPHDKLPFFLFLNPKIGGRLVAQHKAKKTHQSRRLGGVSVLRSSQLANASRSQKSVNRAYGGEVAHNDLRDR